jgi:hypothetical protein
MRYLALLFILVLAVPLAAQPNMDGMDQPPLVVPDGLRIVFDASVMWSFGGILANPLLEFIQTQPSFDAYLVLTQPTAAALGGYRLQLDVVGDHVVTSEEAGGAPLSIALVDDDLTVVYDPPLPMSGETMILYRWSILNPTFRPISFYIKPPSDGTIPVYFDGSGAEIPAPTFNGLFHEYQAPVAVLNGFVTPNEEASFGDVKALFR